MQSACMVSTLSNDKGPFLELQVDDIYLFLCIYKANITNAL